MYLLSKCFVLSSSRYSKYFFKEKERKRIPTEKNGSCYLDAAQPPAMLDFHCKMWVWNSGTSMQEDHIPETL